MLMWNFKRCFFVGVYYSIRDEQTLKKERIEQLKELSKNN